jgi:EAL domain-containing protein (putative c-di-GMP-specific phosphodiesterase class I)
MADWSRFAEHGLALRLALNMPVSVVGTSEFIPLMRRFLPPVPSFPGLIIEVTEDEVIRDAVLIRETAAQLKLYNASIAIDDFGAGHSSLARLIELPCGELKLDRSFVIGCATDAAKRAVCESVIALAHRFGAVVCAEGLEAPGDLRCLIEMGCDIAQGYLFARPMPPDQFLKNMAAPRLQDAPPAPRAHAPQP